jgi:hypothetical protein
MLRRPVCALLTLVALACSGCMGEDDNEAEIARADLGRLVLQPEDLPRVFTQFDFGELGRTDIRSGPREDPRRFGRETGWKARYSRSGSAETAGPLVVESKIDLFADEEGADRDLEAYRAELEATVKQVGGEGTVLSPELGDAAVGITLRQGSQARSIRLYALAWRQANATSFLSVNGFEAKLSLDDAVRLARKQERRIAAVLGS